ncbi:alpha/beta fold hydrolase [Streptomyces longwoodensis]|uniref:thioesterase II family protein n=1 Tax=Streptomyces longwoodensis TaxID=68231 RepID=UPI002DDBC08D|nr:alpha/beta fold hydrolase [Streptomyces longwoodensis]WRY91447.1 alpha/beta fold hydrolase [Streptomyces longwoodensis]WTI44259.1 alpha/beta fold hydrolase [Streptomyces longwoodensis]
MTSPSPSHPVAPTLLCVPHAAGVARAFTGLGQALGPHAHTVALELPGHGTRMREPVRDDFAEVLEDLVRATGAHTARPYVLLGHSMGAAFAYELARHWSALGRPPRAVLLVGRNGPTARSLLPDLHGLPDDAFLDGVRRLGGTPPQLFDHPELVALFTPVLRADFTLSETYAPLPGPPLGCPLWVSAGTDDPMVDDAGLRDWENHADGDVHVEWLPGGHFLLDDPAFQGYVAGVLRRLPQPVV